MKKKLNQQYLYVQYILYVLIYIIILYMLGRAFFSCDIFISKIIIVIYGIYLVVCENIYNIMRIVKKKYDLEERKNNKRIIYLKAEFIIDFVLMIIICIIEGIGISNYFFAVIVLWCIGLGLFINIEKLRSTYKD